MKRHLFFTGPIGCGKSTAIQAALGTALPQCGGFLTRRHREPQLRFTLERPDGTIGGTFLDFSSGQPEVHLDVFSEAYLQGSVLVLDEIGGIELLNPGFFSALETALARDIPILGVVKDEGPAGKLIDRLGLTDEYIRRAQWLRQQLRSDPDTLVYTCSHHDPIALLLARQWAEEYLHGNLF